jgi:hypothetical protein
MSEIDSFISDAAQSGRAVDYQDHFVAVNKLMRERDEAQIQVMGHRRALEMLNREAGLPPDNEDYSKVAAIVNELRGHLTTAVCVVEGCERCGMVGWEEDPRLAIWRTAAGIDN